MSMRRFYIIRSRSDDSIVAVGSAVECAARMRLTLNSFYTIVSRCRNGKIDKYEVDVEMEDSDEQVD